MAETTVLIVDDDDEFHSFVTPFLSGYRLLHAYTSWECVETLARTRVDVVMLDLNLPDAAGFKVLENIREEGDGVAVLVISSYVDRDIAERASAYGACEVLGKAYETYRQLPRLIQKALETPSSGRRRWDRHRSHHRSFARLEQSENLAVQRAVRDARNVAATGQPVLIVSEPGGDRELLGRYVHAWSGTPAAPFVTTTAQPTRDFARSLFGHSRSDDSIVEAANRGYLFLDQIHRLNAESQQRLLQLVEHGTVSRQPDRGPGSLVQVKVRLVAATTEHPQQIRCRGLLDVRLTRLLDKCLYVTPLRDRPGDLEEILDELVQDTAAGMGLPPPVYDAELVNALMHYSFPGNELELAAMVTQVCASKPGQRITVGDFLRAHSPNDW